MTRSTPPSTSPTPAASWPSGCKYYAAYSIRSTHTSDIPTHQMPPLSHDRKILRLCGEDGEMAVDREKVPLKESIEAALGALIAKEASREGSDGKDGAEKALVADTYALAAILKYELQGLMLKLCDACVSVVCARVSPKQKAKVVEMVRASLGSRACAYGREPAGAGSEGDRWLKHMPVTCTRTHTGEGGGPHRPDAFHWGRRQRRAHAPVRAHRRGRVRARGAAGRQQLGLCHRAGQCVCVCAKIKANRPTVINLHQHTSLVHHSSASLRTSCWSTGASTTAGRPLWSNTCFIRSTYVD